MNTGGERERWRKAQRLVCLTSRAAPTGVGEAVEQPLRVRWTGKDANSVFLGDNDFPHCLNISREIFKLKCFKFWILKHIWPKSFQIRDCGPSTNFWRCGKELFLSWYITCSALDNVKMCLRDRALKPNNKKLPLSKDFNYLWFLFWTIFLWMQLLAGTETRGI